MANYEIDPGLLAPFIPAGTELDFFEGKTFVSVVGFMFLNTRVCGIPIPLHRHFPEVNLRFYVRRQADDGWRRGVVFIKEIVPRRAIAWTARTLYNENYVALPMSHQLEKTGSKLKSVSYSWKFFNRWHSLSAEVHGEPQPLMAGSQPEFIAAHYWGYCRQRDGSSAESQVEHPPWRIWEADSARLDGDVTGIYGAQFGETLSRPAASVFVADGSAITVRKGVRFH